MVVNYAIKYKYFPLKVTVFFKMFTSSNPSICHCKLLSLAPQIYFKKSSFHTRAKPNKTKWIIIRQGFHWYINMCIFGFVVTLTNKPLISPVQLPGSSITSMLHTTTSGDVFRRCYIKLWTFWYSHHPSESAEPESLWYVPSNWMDLSFEIGFDILKFPPVWAVVVEVRFQSSVISRKQQVL